MRLLITADLHYNHPRSRPLADEVIEQMNAAGGDVLLLVGDTAVSDGDCLEQCLGRFRFSGPKLFVAGNHELWTRGDDSYALWRETLPARIRALGWQWLESDPFITPGLAIVGSIGWYDYAFARPELGIPHRFYEKKVSPGAAERFEEFTRLFDVSHDIAPAAREVVARWNDGKFIKLHRSDKVFLEELLTRLEAQLQSLSKMPTILAAIHHLPFAELLPPPHSAQWDFAKAYLGSPRLGELLLRHPNVRQAFCGHSHLPARARIGDIEAVNIGSGYRWKTYETVDIAT